MSRPNVLIFVYNADGGISSFLRRLVAPHSYPCSLCKLTHGAFGMKGEWREFLKGLKIPMVFLHRKELKKKYGIQNLELPGIFQPYGDKMRAWIDADEIKRCRDLAALKRLIERRLSEAG